MAIHITFLRRYDSGLCYGGAEVQTEQTAHYLRELGVRVDFFTPQDRGVGDVVHAFGTYPYFHSVAKYCWLHRKPFVLSSIFYKDISSLRLRVRYQIYKLFPKQVPQIKSMKRLLNLACVLLPNTQAEALQLQQIFRLSPQRIEVIPNGVEARFAEADPDWFRRETGIREPFVLCVGRIEPRKNQHRLIRALSGTGIPLVLIGNPISDDYLALCRELASDSVYFLPAVPHDSPLLAGAYAACRVFALPSLLETPGIAALEAGVAGARVVVTPYGGAREYFGDYALYPEPRSVQSIRQAVLQAWETPHDPDTLRQHLLTHFSWETVAQKTLQVYQRVLAES
ncbi:MAG: glycosyltransferase family 4 protein [Fimbriimonadales bacterium]